MKRVKKEECDYDRCCSGHKEKHIGSAVYCLGFIGAAIYYISTASSTGWAFIGFLKAIVWPVFLVFEALKFLAI